MTNKPVDLDEMPGDDNITETVNFQLVCQSITWIEIDRVNRGNRRLRRRSDQSLRKLVRSIQHTSFFVPPVLDNKLRVLDGDGRIDAAIEIGINKIPVIIVDHLPPADLEALSLVLNRAQEDGKFNEEVVQDKISFILDECPDYDLEFTGFELGEIETHLSAIEDHSDSEEPDPADAVPTAMLEEGYVPTSRAGDLFLVKGKQFEHRVYCGDACSPEALSAAVGGKVPAMVLNDPPFDVPIQGHVGGNGKIKHREFVMGSGELGKKKYYRLLCTSLHEATKKLEDGGLAYVFMDKKGLELLLKAGRKLGLKLQSVNIWKKTNAGMGSLYRSQHEFVVIFKKGKSPHTNNIGLGKYGRTRTTVQEYPGFNTFSKERKQLFHLHPTLKPTQMLGDYMRDVTKRGDVVLDSFAGAGSTLIAAETTGRQSVSIELDPIYIDTILKRFEDQFGVEAVHANTGLTVSELRDKRFSTETQDPVSAAGEVASAAERPAPLQSTGRIRTRKSLKQTTQS